MIVFVDIDETICKTPESRDYRDSQPIKKNIKKINLLYEQGHTVIYWTARGSGTGLDWRDVTEKQFEDWNDYIAVMKKMVPKDATFVKASKRPFSFDFILKENGFTYRIIATNRHMEWKRIK